MSHATLCYFKLHKNKLHDFYLLFVFIFDNSAELEAVILGIHTIHSWINQAATSDPHT